ncbi:suppressor of cytokine signaling 7-like [Chanos chanos]|uniref:Suppressor of cytokine signaling 7 n=1 Tax=Chanos chanos TaxID=29144 RepID=A0A6J2WZE9_CHACN|nr:suppressor of cytokine signaling 7-like [Chanos chanos]
MVFQNLLRPGDGILECGLEQSGFQVGEPDKQDVCSAGLPSSGIGDSTICTADTHQKQPLPRFQWHPVMKLTKVAVDANKGGERLCHRHQLVTDSMDWPPLLDKSLHFGILDPRKTCPLGSPDPHMEDPVLNLARRLGELGQASNKLLKEGEMPRCSCQSILASATGGIGPGEDPSETSDALLVLEGLGSEEVSELGMVACPGDGYKGDVGARPFTQEGNKETGLESDVTGSPATAFSSSSLSGLMHQVRRLAGEACCDPQACRPLWEPLGLQVPPSDGTAGDPSAEAAALPPSPLRGQEASAPAPAPAPLSRPPTPKHVGSPLAVAAQSPAAGGDGDRAGRGKSRKGSLKVRLSKLFRTKSNSGGNSHLTDKRPSLASSTSSGGSLMDVWGSSSSEPDTGSRPQLPRPQSAFSPVSYSPAFTDTLLRGVPRPTRLQQDSQVTARGGQPPLLCPLSRADASSFATSLRELEKCGWYWGPMNWEDAEMKLKGKPDGSFLVRDSSDPRYILSLSFRSQGVTHHTRMEHYRGTFSLWCHPKFEDRCHSVVEFIERAIMHSKNGKFLYFLRSRVPGLPPTPVQLLYPVSRFSSVKSLQHLCRFCIRQLVRIDHIQDLPLPTPLIMYLSKFYYYDPEEEMYLSIKETGRDTGAAQGVESQT